MLRSLLSPEFLAVMMEAFLPRVLSSSHGLASNVVPMVFPRDQHSLELVRAVSFVSRHGFGLRCDAEGIFVSSIYYPLKLASVGLWTSFVTDVCESRNTAGYKQKGR